jgi:hypothetical protein
LFVTGITEWKSYRRIAPIFGAQTTKSLDKKSFINTSLQKTRILEFQGAKKLFNSYDSGINTAFSLHF